MHLLDWSILATAIKDTAPMLGTVLLGPMGSVAGRLIANAIGMNGSNPADLAKAITAGNGSFADVLKELEANHAGLLTYFSNMKPISKIRLSVEFSQ